MNIIDQIEAEEVSRLTENKTIPTFGPGDTVRVNVKVKEGTRERIQAYEGVCISRSGSGYNESFTVRKLSYGEGVERVFPIYSPLVESIDVVRRGKVRRAKLYYLRGRTGRAARIVEKVDHTRRRAKGETRAKYLQATDASAALFARPDGAGDDLTKISGVGAVLVEKLNGLGITKFEQIANFSADDIARVDDALSFKGRIDREDWVSQAKELAK